MRMFVLLTYSGSDIGHAGEIRDKRKNEEYESDLRQTTVLEI